MDDLAPTISGQAALDVTRKLDPAALPLVEAILRGDLEGTRAGGWAWGVLGHTVPDGSLLELSRTVGEISHQRPKKKRHADEEDVELTEELRAPIEIASGAVARAEAERQAVLPEHRAARSEAEWAVAAGQAAARRLKR